MRPNSRVAALAVVAVVVLAACGSSSGSKSSGSSPTSPTSGGGSGSSSHRLIDVCKIITTADAQKVIGGRVEAEAPAAGTEGLSSGVCIYKASGVGIRVSLLQVRVYPGPQFYGEQALPNTKSIDISGTDKAFVRQAAGGKTIDVQFVKDGKTGTINFTDTGATAPDAAVTNVEAVAKKLADAI